MINCPKCGADNMIGAIFCRTCSAKLELDDLSPEVFDEKGDSLAKRVGDIALRVCVVVIILLVVAMTVAMLLPVSGMLTPEPDQKLASRLELAFRRMQKPTRRNYRYAFSSEQITALANHAFGLESLGGEGNIAAPEGGMLVPEQVSVEFLAEGNTKMVLRSRLMGFLTVHSTLVGAFDASGGDVSFDVHSAKVGRLSLVANLKGLAVNQFVSLLESSGDAGRIRNLIQALEISENSVRVTLKMR